MVVGVHQTAAPPLFIRLISHPLRWRMVVELARSDLRVRELCGIVDVPQNLVSYHLRVLRSGGVVTSRRSSFDARESYYHLDLDRCADGLARAGAALHPVLRMSRSPAPSVGRSRVLFVCSGNSARSPIAEALLRHRAGDRVQVSSVGTHPKERIHPDAVRVLREQFSIDIEGQTPRPVDLVRGQRFDRVITLCDKARKNLRAADDWPRVHWSIPDPAADADSRTGYRRFVSTAIEIDSRVRYLMPTLSPTNTAGNRAADNEEDQP